MSEMTIPHFVASMTRAIGAFDATAKVALHKGAVIIQKEAQSAIGTYRYGWPALSAATIARKQTGDSPLLETGELRASIEITELTGEAWIGSNNPKIEWHTFGTPTIPPRPIMEPAAIAREKEVIAILEKGLIGGFFGFFAGEAEIKSIP